MTKQALEKAIPIAREIERQERILFRLEGTKDLRVYIEAPETQTHPAIDSYLITKASRMSDLGYGRSHINKVDAALKSCIEARIKELNKKLSEL